MFLNPFTFKRATFPRDYCPFIFLFFCYLLFWDFKQLKNTKLQMVFFTKHLATIFSIMNLHNQKQNFLFLFILLLYLAIFSFFPLEIILLFYKLLIFLVCVFLLILLLIETFWYQNTNMFLKDNTLKIPT